MSERARVAIVEDEPLIALDLRCICEDLGHEVVAQAASARQAFDHARAFDPDCCPEILLTDMELKTDGDGVDVALEFRRCFREIKVVFITGTRNPEMLARIFSAEPDEILMKPASPAEINTALQSVRWPQAPSRAQSS